MKHRGLVLSRTLPTEQQYKVLDFIRKFMKDKYMPPTQREIMLEMGYKSPRAVSWCLLRLVEKGFLRRAFEGIKCRNYIPTTSDEQIKLRQEEEMRSL